MPEVAVALVFLGVVLAIYVWLLVVGWTMATRRGQPPLLWLIIAVFGSPFISIILLWLFFSVRDDANK